MVPSSSVDKYLFVKCGRGRGGLKKLLPNPRRCGDHPLCSWALCIYGGLKEVGKQMPLPLVEVSKVVTPLNVRARERQLQDLPDCECAEFVSQGLREGFHIGFDRKKVKCLTTKSNMLSASRNPAVVEEYLAKELAHGRVVQADPRKMDIHINCFGVIPKGHQASTWRLIVDMSHPKGRSVNDGTDPALCSLSYATVEMAAQRVLSLEKGTLWQSLI